MREKEFVEAARSLGASNRRIIFREILPNLTAPLIVYSSLLIPTNILFEAALSYLGVGIRPPTASWGQMISDATADLQYGLVVHGLSRSRPAPYRACVQPGRRRPAGRAQPARRVAMSHQLVREPPRTFDHRRNHPMRGSPHLIAYAIAVYSLLGSRRVVAALELVRRRRASSASSSGIKSPPLKPGENPVGQQLLARRRAAC